jgi:diguanylate cyclase (GGDEF)-like protein
MKFTLRPSPRPPPAPSMQPIPPAPPAAPGPANTGRRSLGSALQRAHLGVALIAVSMAGITLTLAGLFTLRALVNHDLSLTGRSMSYTVEAAVVFDDRAAAADTLGIIASTEEIASVELYNAHGLLLAAWSHSDNGSFYPIEQTLARLILPPPLTIPVMHQGKEVGTIRLVGRGDSLLLFLLRGLGGMAACLILSVLSALYLSQRMLGGITGPLRDLGAVAHAVRRERAFSLRVPPAEIAELNTLGDDFNSLLDELQSWQAGLQSENEALAHKAAHDSLTGLPNRGVFEDALAHAVKEARAHGSRVATLFLDNDRFKEINDRLGHAAGDAVLVSVAARVRGLLRKHDLVARIGGDEFAVLLAPLHDTYRADALVASIVNCMCEPIVLPGGGTVVTSLSVGVAIFPDHAADPEGLLSAADAAMYRAKSARRDGGQDNAVTRLKTGSTSA